MRVQIRTRPAPASVFEGQELTLVCSVDGAREPVLVSWHRRPRPGLMTTRLPRGPELRIPAVSSSDAGQYQCEAGLGPASYRSEPVTVAVRGASAGERTQHRALGQRVGWKEGRSRAEP